ncbi:glutamate receptor 2.8-like [Phragmites australis]|uniref:glutamate receptor 2.8-like n=1 Tax=Phragmites australis TaxID=29695 RepID=UPI002D78DF03|nr:glutamate receptor 2.8-like [Phragmites australis]
MECPSRCFRLAVGVLVLLARRDALAALPVAAASAAAATVPAPRGSVVAADVAACDARGKSRKESPTARAARRMGLHVSGSSGDAIAQARSLADTERTDARELTKINSGAVSRGYEKKLRIAVPRRHGFKAFVNVTHPNTERQKVTGYSIDVFKTSVEKLQYPPQYEFCVFDGTYDELVHNVSIGVYDAAVGDVTITAERVRDADFTMPYAQSGLSLLVLSDNDSKPIQWIFLDPLTKELWFATVGGFFFTGFVVWMIEWPRNLEFQGLSLRQFSNASYFAFSTLTFSHDQIIRSPLSRFVVVIWCFVVLVLVQSYTANFSSILTAKRLRPLVTNLDQLVLNGDYIGYQHGGFVRSFLIKQGVPVNRLKAYINQTEYAEALRKGSKNGGVSAIVDEIPYLNYFLSDRRYMKEFEMVSRIYRTPGLGFVFPLGSPLVHNLSIAILDLTGGNEVSQIEEKWLGTAALSVGVGSPIADSAPLTLRSFSGLFVITGCVSTLMLLIRIARSVYARYTRMKGAGLQNADTDGGAARLGEPTALRDDMADGSVPDQSYHEVRDENSVGAYGGGGSTGDEEAGQIQDSMYNGSVPEVSVQIEMSITGHGVGMRLSAAI